MKSNLLTRIVFLLAFLFTPGVVFAGDIVVITSPGTAINSLSAKDVRNIYLGRIKSVNNVTVTPVDLTEETPARAQFMTIIINKSPRQFKSHWVRLVFSGKASPMPVVESEQEVIDWVLKNAGGIGYISESAITNAVKVIYK